MCEKTIFTHDMNSVMEIGDKTCIYLPKEKKWWEGKRDEIWETNNVELNDLFLPLNYIKN